MSRFLRVLKAALVNGVLWAFAWGGVGAGLGMLTGGPQVGTLWASYWGFVGLAAGLTWTLGLIAGTTFAFGLATMERLRTLDDLHYGRIGALGIAAGIATLLSLAGLLQFVSGASVDLNGLSFTIFGALGCASSVGTLALARSGEELPATPERVAIGGMEP